jgi:site-specific DNA recombinase
VASRAAIYTRISEDRLGDRAGVDRQRADCEDLIGRRGWELAGVYVDNDVSATNGKRRAEYVRLLDDLKAGAFDVIVAWHPDRLHRRPAELESFIELLEATGAGVATVQAGELDLATPSGRLVARMLGAVARHEVEHKSARQRRKHEELARAGRDSGGGDRPYGFERDRRTIREPEAAVIREAAERVLAGESLRGLASDLNRRELRPVRGGPWRSSTLKQVLTSARVAGLRSYRGDVVADAEWPAIIDRESHERLRAVLNDPSRDRRNAAPARSYLLTGGAARCGLCASALVARPRDDGRRTYVCASPPNFDGCGKIRVLAEPLEELVAETIFAALDSDRLTAAIRAVGDRSDDGAALEKLAEIGRRLDELADLFAGGTITSSEWLTAREKLERRQEQTERRLSTDSRARVFTGIGNGAEAVRGAWAGRDLEWRRRLVAAVVERVDVGPAVRGRNRFDPDRISLVWRV